MAGKDQKHVVIVGAGIVGLSTAYFAQERGWEVTIVDRNPPTGDSCSLGNSGMIVPSHFVPLAAPGAMGQAIRWMRDPESPFSINPSLSLDMLKWGLRFYLASTKAQVDQAAPLLRDLNMASRNLYVKWADSGIDAGLIQKGLLMLCNSESMLHEEALMAQQAQSLGIPAEILSAASTASLDPNLTMDIKGSVYYPKDCHLDPIKLLGSLRSMIERRGGQFKWNHHASGWVSSDNRVRAIQTSAGVIEGDEFVLAGGIWTEALAKSLRLNVSMLAGKGYSFTLPNPIQLPSICSILCEARVAVTPMGDRLRFGGTMTIGKPDQMISPEKLRGIKKSVANYFPRFDESHFDGIEPWVGLRPVTPDGLPYIGRAKEWRNLTIATGHAMMGLSLGPITGQLVSEILDGRKTSISLERLSPDRYAA